MNNVIQSANTRSHGISVVEILIALAVLTVIVAFASSSFSNATDRAELQATVEGVNFSVQSARSTARRLETEVILHLNADPNATHHSISFSVPGKNAELSSSSMLQEFQFPSDIRLESDEPTIQFDSRGMVDTPVRLLLVSTADENVSERLLIE
jgi:Tfp pilus assembly protein FimT